ncbi:polysaccharide biosynthesis protein [Candidatus Electrothrix sp.]|uniref:polysaccharide biosynthesis protein n=1 Tax=Candidatus Electrothrix sp. TaxID=2170559 RepID=UPI00405671E6
MNDYSILITGGTGTVGQALLPHLLKTYPDIRRINVFSRDEQKHYDMTKRFPPSQYPVRYILGDVRDRERIIMACKDVNVIVHTAAMKHVPESENNPVECAKTNILGTQNVVDAAVINGVERVVALSSDKAVSPINTYGASKLFLEKLFLDANAKYDTKFSLVRYANVFGSKGSVVPFFLQKKTEGYLPITDSGMTRFSITMQEGLELILFAIEHGWGGEIIVPISPSYRITDVAEAIAPGIEQRVVGIRPGEKLHETMVGAYESERTVRLGNRYIVCPLEGKWTAEEFCSQQGTSAVEPGFEYSSGNNSEWLTVDQLRQLVFEFTDI